MRAGSRKKVGVGGEGGLFGEGCRIVDCKVQYKKCGFWEWEERKEGLGPSNRGLAGGQWAGGRGMRVVYMGFMTVLIGMTIKKGIKKGRKTSNRKVSMRYAVIGFDGKGNDFQVLEGRFIE